MSNFIKIKCECCKHEFRKKCKKVCVWQSEKSRFYDMFEDDLEYADYDDDIYIGEGLYMSDMFPDDEDNDDDFEENKLYNDGKLLPQYGQSQCPSCTQVFWFEKVDKIKN